MTPFAVSYDYRCPFAKNIHLHVIAGLRAGAAWDVTFVPWTLNQVHREEGAPDVWDDPAMDDSLVALAAGVSVHDQQPDLFLDAHEALFRARHEQSIRLHSMDEIVAVLAPLGVDTRAVADDVASRRPHKVIAESYREFEAYEAFGVPTFVVEDDAVFVRYMTTPSSDPAASIPIIDRIVAMVARDKDLNEFKHTQIES